MIAQGDGGRVVLISSMNALQSQVGAADYDASKAGMHGLMRAMAVELAPKGITVNAIAPGWIRTEMSAPELEHLRDRVLNPSRRVGTPADIARASLWLVDPANQYVTGTTVVVDGGQTAMLPNPWTEAAEVLTVMTPAMDMSDATPPELAPLFEPLTLGTVTLRNRIVMAGHSTGMAENHLPSERHVAYYRERAIGGAGLIGVAFPAVHPSTEENGELRAYDPAIVPGLRRIADAVHAHGARIAMQLGHSGRQSSSVLTERPLWAPSNVPCPFNLEMPKEMELEDIDAIVGAHAVGARHARDGGMDGVELQSGYGGYLLASFLSEFSNRRDDEYGGALENRVRILLRVIDAIRAEVGHDYLVGLNLQGHDFSPHGLEVADAQAIARAVEDNGGVDYIYVKGATYFEANQNVPDMQHPKLIWSSLAAAVKSAVSIPVVAVGRIPAGVEAAELITSGKADLVALTRQQIADPETVNKLREGRLDDVRPCVACNQGCIDRLFAGSSASCIHNPAAGYELELGVGTLKSRRDPEARRRRRSWSGRAEGG